MGDLTWRQREILTRMRDENEELVYESGIGYIGLERVGGSVVTALLRLVAISLDPFSTVGEFERYTINSVGLELLNVAGGEKEELE